jgi:hypothetical protein
MQGLIISFCAKGQTRGILLQNSLLLHGRAKLWIICAVADPWVDFIKKFAETFLRE